MASQWFVVRRCGDLFDVFWLGPVGDASGTKPTLVRCNNWSTYPLHRCREYVFTYAAPGDWVIENEHAFTVCSPATA